MEDKKITRTRFAPSPSGIMHLGNIRSALVNYICAKEQNGIFILRIEDTDRSRTSQIYLDNIYIILNILGLVPDEGPCQGGDFGPYIQSERDLFYKKYLNLLQKKGLLYRCFKTHEELDAERQMQIALKLPPRYKRAAISIEEENKLLEKNIPFIWRLQINPVKTSFFDKVKGIITFDLENFADCPLTRQDGTFTFLFANLVDDIVMEITDVIRGEEHLSNTVIQSYLYDVLNVKKPLFYHLPLIVDQQGKKLSKRNFGFNIFDLLEGGYLPQAIINYIGIIGMSLEHEILSLDQMIQSHLFSQMKSSGLITYDIEKLLWINKKWMQAISLAELKKLVYALTENNIHLYKNNINVMMCYNDEVLEYIKKESHTIKDFFDHLTSMNTPMENQKIIFVKDDAVVVNYSVLFLLENAEKEVAKEELHFFAKQWEIPLKKIFQVMRKILIQKEEGLGVLFLIKQIKKSQIQVHIKNIIYI